MPVGIRILLYLGTGTFLDTFTVKIFYTKTHVYPNVGGYCTMFIDADKQSYPEYLELSLKLSRSGTIIFLDNVIRAGEILNPDNHKPSIEGIRDMFKAMQNHSRILSCTALQTVGSKGHDGFALAIVK